MSQPLYPTGDQTLLREMNLAAIMNHVRERAPVSRTALAGATGLNKTTVSSLVRELIDRGFLHEINTWSNGIGRPAVMLELNPQAGCIISCEIGVDFILVIRANFSSEIVWRHQERTQPELGQDAIMQRVLALLHRATEPQSGCRTRLLGLAIGIPGLIDQESGTVLFAPNLGWQNIPVRDLLRAEFDTPLFVDNEANLAALGEYYFGAATGYDEVLYISDGVGLGGGIVRNGQLFKGATGFAGEFGHMTMDPNGLECNCGNRGCWETLVSQRALFRLVREAIEAGQSTLVTQLVNGDLDRMSIATVVQAARANDSVALEALATIGRYLGIGIANLVNALNPKLVVFGGILSLAWDYLAPAIREELHRRALRWNESAARLVLARHGFDACVMGGIAMLYYAILTQPATMVRQMAMH
jgi:glucokinase-like ROK family protein